MTGRSRRTVPRKSLPMTKFDHAGKRVFVSGSTSGIGKATALLFAASGARVVIHGRDRARAEAVCARINEDGGEAIAVLGSMDSDEDASRIAAEVGAALGGIDILVCNAGDAQPFSPDWFGVEPAAWLRNYDRNVLGSVRLIHAFVPGMRERQWGRVILIGSSAYFTPITDFPAYGPSKAALANMMVNLTEVLANSGVTVNTISPGSVLTETMAANLQVMADAEGWDETEPAVIERRLIAEKWPNAAGRMGRPEEIAATAAFVASEEAAYMSGAHIRVNGGEKPSLH